MGTTPSDGFRLLLVLLVGGFAVAFVMALLFARRGRVTQPSCGSCGYAVAGLEVLRCPECGSDLRQVGIVTARMRREIGPFAWAVILTIIWTALLPVPAILITTIVEGMLPRYRTETMNVTLSNPASRAYQSFDISLAKRGSDRAALSTDSVTVTLTLSDGTQSAPLDVDPDSLASTGQVGGLLDWVGQTGIDVEDTAVQSEAAAVERLLAQFAQGGNTVSTGGDFSSVSSRGGMQNDPTPARRRAAAPIFWFLVWLIPLIVVFRRAARVAPAQARR